MTLVIHDLPYVQPSLACPCPIQTCGAIIINPDCPDHGHRRTPATERHIAGNERCQYLTNSREHTPMSDDTANHRPEDQDPEIDETPMWDDRLAGLPATDTPPPF